MSDPYKGTGKIIPVVLNILILMLLDKKQKQIFWSDY
jgi:hypothetical protein